MKVLIVAKTRVGVHSCVGAISLPDHRPLRLLAYDGGHQLQNTPYAVGSVWDIDGECAPLDSIKPPHTEDFRVARKTLLESSLNLREFIIDHLPVIQGKPSSLFDGALLSTKNGSGYVSKSHLVPQYSTGFWLTGDCLEYEDRFRRFRYCGADTIRLMPYVGYERPVSLSANSLIRVSLARWWKPEDSDSSLEMRCYLQISGWYD